MEVPLEIHPSEILRHFRLFCENLVSDFDLRYPEARKRRAYELALEGISSETLRHFESFPPDKMVSVLDWPQLLEWNERWQQAEIASALHSELMKTSPTSSELVRVIKVRLKEIHQECRTAVIPKEPSLWELIRFRWRFSGLREEAFFLLKRLRELNVEPQVHKQDALTI